MSFNTKIYDSTNNNYNTNFDTYIIGNNNIPVNGNLYYNNKFGKLMTSFIVDGGDSILGGNVIISENTTVYGKCDFKNDLTIAGNVYIPGKIITPSSNLLSGPTGPSGSQGIVGLTGPSGSQGIVGLTGPSGMQGIVGLTGPSSISMLLTKPTLYSTIFSNITLDSYDLLKTASFILLSEGVYMIKFILQIISNDTLNQKGALEYGLSYDKTAITLSKNRLIIDTRSEFNINTGLVNIDSSQPYIFHEYLIRTYGTTTTINLNVKCISYDQSLKNTYTSLKVTQSYLVANQIA